MPLISYDTQQTIRIAWYEPARPREILAAWCYLANIVIIELTVPVLFGYILSVKGITELTGWFAISAGLLFLMDKLAILMLAYCVVTTVLDFILERI